MVIDGAVISRFKFGANLPCGGGPAVSDQPLGHGRVARRVNRSFFRIFLGRTRVDRLDFVGLTEDYARSLQLFEAIFGCELTEYRRNVNQARPDDYGTYLQDRGVHQTVSRLMAENQRTYDLARRRFETLCREFGV